VKAALVTVLVLLMAAGLHAQPESVSATEDAPTAASDSASSTAPASEAAEEKTAAEQVQPQEPSAEAVPEAPPQKQTRPLNTTLSGRSLSELFLQRPQIVSLGNGTYASSKQKLYPFYETISLRADQVFHPGLSVHLEGWAGLDMADLYFDERVVAGRTYLYVPFRGEGLLAIAAG
jgi:hypothetical protein